MGSTLAEAHQEPFDYNTCLRPVNENLNFAFTTTSDEMVVIVVNMKDTAVGIVAMKDTAVGHDELPFSLFLDNIKKIIFCETCCLFWKLSMRSGIMLD